MLAPMRALLPGLAAAVVLSGTSVAAAPPKLTAVSFTHPSPNPGYSYVCAKVKGTPNATVRVRASGPAGQMTTRVKLGATGRGIASFRIETAGDYVLKASASQRSITVPPPPDPPQGTFTCPSA